MTTLSSGMKLKFYFWVLEVWLGSLKNHWETSGFSAEEFCCRQQNSVHLLNEKYLLLLTLTPAIFIICHHKPLDSKNIDHAHLFLSSPHFLSHVFYVLAPSNCILFKLMHYVLIVCHISTLAKRIKKVVGLIPDPGLSVWSLHVLSRYIRLPPIVCVTGIFFGSFLLPRISFSSSFSDSHFTFLGQNFWFVFI